MSSVSRWRFNALDTWFFRESRPMESIGGSELQSTFPPPARSVAGAIRYLIGETAEPKVNWSEWNQKDKYPEVKALMGDSSSYGKLLFSGPWLSRIRNDGQRERLYPVPANLVASRDMQGVDKPVRLLVGSPHHCDLGQNVRMAELAVEDLNRSDEKKLKSLDDYWITASALLSILSGAGCEASDLISSRELFDNEARLGIARNNTTRTVEMGMLYQTRHVRPKQNVSIEMHVLGLKERDYPASGIVRLGGEGRGASFDVDHFEVDSKLESGKSDVAQLVGSELVQPSTLMDAKGIMLFLLTPMTQELNQYSPLPGFEQAETADGTVWRGAVQGVKLSLHCVIQAKAIREGGWDLAQNCPRAVQSLVPAGTVYYLTVDDGDIASAMSAIHLSQLSVGLSSEKLEKIPEDVALGRGLVAAGVWPKSEWIEKE